MQQDESLDPAPLHNRPDRHHAEQRPRHVVTRHPAVQVADGVDDVLTRLTVGSVAQRYVRPDVEVLDLGVHEAVALRQVRRRTDREHEPADGAGDEQHDQEGVAHPDVPRRRLEVQEHGNGRRDEEVSGAVVDVPAVDEERPVQEEALDFELVIDAEPALDRIERLRIAKSDRGFPHLRVAEQFVEHGRAEQGDRLEDPAAAHTRAQRAWRCRLGNG